MAESSKSAKNNTPYKNLFRELEKRSVFTDLSVFDTDYIPDHIFVRQEFDPIVRFYFDAIKFSLPQTMIIVGPSGSGKTLACRFYAAEAIRHAEKERIALSSAYINCREIAAPYVFWQLLLEQFNAPAPKGLSITDLLTKLAQAVSDCRHIVVVLDELEKLFVRVGNERANDILYSLTRLRANRNLDVAISTIFISNNAHLLDLFDGPLKSSLNLTKLAIGPYGADELGGILMDRANAGLKEGTWNQGIINYIAAKTAQYNSDARFAIRLMKNAARWLESSQGKNLTTEHVEQAFEDTRREMELEVLQRLSASQLLVLLALAMKGRAGNDRFIGLHQVYKETYPVACQQYSRTPLVYSQFLYTVNVLQSHDLVNNMLERRRRGGFSRLVEINFNPADVIRIASTSLHF